MRLLPSRHQGCQDRRWEGHTLLLSTLPTGWTVGQVWVSVGFRRAFKAFFPDKNLKRSPKPSAADDSLGISIIRIIAIAEFWQLPSFFWEKPMERTMTEPPPKRQNPSAAEPSLNPKPQSPKRLILWLPRNWKSSPLSCVLRGLGSGFRAHAKHKPCGPQGDELPQISHRAFPKPSWYLQNTCKNQSNSTPLSHHVIEHLVL